MPAEPGRPAPASSLGRYTPPAGDAPLVEVRLLNLPVQLLAAAREHHDGLMREFRLVALSGRVGSSEAPPRLLELTHILGETWAASAERGDEVFEAALDEGRVVMDVEEHVPAGAAAVIADVGRLMDEADAFCADELLMTMPRPPLLRRFADWYTQEYVRQTAGEPPRPWDGPLTVDEQPG